MEGALNLPDWTQGLLVEQSDINCSPPKKPLAQVTLKDGNTQRVSALGRPGGSGGAAAAGGSFKPAFPLPAAAPPPPVQDAGQPNDAENHASPAAGEPRSAPRLTHTPSRTGLSARAVRMPSRLGLTPGTKQPDAFAVTASGAALVGGKGAATTAAPSGAGGNLKSILKRLHFSTTKGRAPAPVLEVASATATVQRQPATAAAAAAQSTIKQLRFDTGTTPAASTAARPAGGSRHVSFDASTVSPATRARPSRPSAAAATTPAWGTPEPTIVEEDSTVSSSGSEDAAPAGGSVNSARAGSTPYDRRLSSLFHKYQVEGTPELAEAELDELVAGGAVSSPSWNRLSSASVPESIRELSKKYSSDAEGGSLTPLAGSVSPAPPSASAAADADAATPVRPRAEGRSPTLDPTPHHVLNSIMKRNALYESPPGAELAQAAAEAAAERPVQDVPSSSAAEPASEQLSPAAAVAQLLGPLLRATIEDINANEAAAAQTGAAPSSAAATPGSAPSAAVSSPAEFYGFPVMGTPSASGPTPRSTGSVPRDSEGVPLVTPGTVTVRRGGYSGRSRDGSADLFDSTAANLFESTFSPSDSLGGMCTSVSPGAGDKAESGDAGSPQLLQEQQSVQDAATPAGATAAAASSGTAGTGPDFSFFPSAAAAAPLGAQRAQQAADTTPELMVAAGGAGTMSSTISPEILGFYEQQEQQQVAQGKQEASSSQAGGPTPVMPRSIIKSGRPLNPAGTPVLGHAQRLAAGEAQPPPTITKELRALMADMKLEDAAEMEQMGTVSALSPVRATGPLKGFLGNLARAITPVRRSARKRTESKPLEAMLEETGYSYVPNAALMAEDAQPKLEAAEAKAARKAASRTASQASAEPSLAGGFAAGGQPEVSSTPARRYSTRSANHAEALAEGEQQEQDSQGAAAAAASTPAAEPAVVGRRMSMRLVRTPQQQGIQVQEEAATPQAAPAAGNVPVAQDASPTLGESPGFGGAAAVAGQAPAASTPSYSLRRSTLKKKAQHATPKAATPKAGGSTLRSAVLGGAKEQAHNNTTPAPSQLSPTEQGIRASLRRSARKSKGPQ